MEILSGSTTYYTISRYSNPMLQPTAAASPYFKVLETLEWKYSSYFSGGDREKSPIVKIGNFVQM